MQLCSGNDYPDCCKHNHLTSAAGEGEGVILLVLGQSGSPHTMGPGGWHVFVYDWKMTLGWLTPLTPGASDILDVTQILWARGSATFLLASSEIQDNKQTVVVQCSSPVPGLHVTCPTCLLCSVKIAISWKFVCLSRLTSAKSDQSHILWVKNNNSWVQFPLNSVNNRSRDPLREG